MTLYTYAEAERLYSISTLALQRLVKAGKITAYKPGAKVLLDGESLATWVKSTKIAPRKKIGRPRKGAARL